MTVVRLIDLTRSLRRAGRVATGVDRVEQAYIARFLSDDVALFGLVRTPLGYLLLDRTGVAQFHKRLEKHAAWGRISFLSRLSRGRDKVVKSAESDLRRFAIAQARRSRLAAMLARHLTGGFDYYNVGHSNLTDRVLQAVTEARGSSHVMVHDVIPLEYPHYQRSGTVAPFKAKLRRVGRHVTRVIYNSRDTQQRTEAYFGAWGRVPEAIVAHLGTIDPVPIAAEVPEGVQPEVPYFVVLGTIEPRKNHAFLLDIWGKMGPDAPALLICGSRGWQNEAVFARLDRLDSRSRIVEIPNLSDGAVAHLVKNSAGMLFPSHAEGYGLPPVEALMVGARVLCNDLAVLREILKDRAVYASVSDVNLWISTIKSWETKPQTAQETPRFSGPNWDDHFKTVLRLK